jgi:prefoldin subunit 5
MEEIIDELKEKIASLEKELSDTRANLHRAYKGIEHYKSKWEQTLEGQQENKKKVKQKVTNI